MYLTCYVSLGYNQTECAMLGSGTRNQNITNLEKLVQPHAAVISMAIDFVNYIMNTFVCLFLGAWSDKYGRKPVLMSSLTGMFLLCYTVDIQFQTYHPTNILVGCCCCFPSFYSIPITCHGSYISCSCNLDAKWFRVYLFGLVYYLVDS